MSGMLSGIRVLDLGRSWAGAIATMLLADYGAEVVKLEFGDGDPLRRFPLHHVFNRNKVSVAADLKTPEGQSTFARLAAGADVLVDTFTPTTAAALRLSPAALEARFPHLVRLSVTGYGHDDARAEEPALEPLVDAWLGMHDEQMGWREGPCYNVAAVGSYGAGLLGAQGVLAALRARHVTGRGLQVETSLVDGAIILNTMFWAWAENDPTSFGGGSQSAHSVRLRTRHLGGFGILPCGDGGYIQMHSGLAGRFTRAMEVFGLADQLEPVAPTDEKKLPLSEHDREILNREVPRILLGKPRQYWIDALKAVDVSVIEIAPPGEALLDRSLSKDIPRTIEDPTLGEIQVVGPVISSSVPGRARMRPAPAAVGGAQVEWEPRRFEPTGRTLEQPLQGIRVVDFGAYFAGPYASRLLADLGADVIKIEPPRGDTLRPTAGVFRAANRGKRGVALDLQTQAGQDAARLLVAGADIVTHSMRPGAAERYRLGFEDVRAINPDIVYLHSTGYGAGTARAHEAIFAPLMAGLGGLSWQAAGEGNTPLGSVSNEDHYNGALGAFAALMGLRHRDQTGEAVFVETSLFGAVQFVMSDLILDARGEIIFRLRLDAQQTGLGPANRMYACADGQWVTLVAADQAHWSALRAIDGLSALPELWRPEFVFRRGEPETFSAVLETWFAGRDAVEALKALQAAGVPAEISGKSRRQDYFNDPVNQRSGRVAECLDPLHGVVRDPGRMIRFSGMAPLVVRPAPTIGQHSAEVLAEVGNAQPAPSRAAATAAE
jgi:crotonobetainyl-CoA:carnitine CoA-transferase CaiB-like acyl-CoA transferase